MGEILRAGRQVLDLAIGAAARDQNDPGVAGVGLQAGVAQGELAQFVRGGDEGGVEAGHGLS